MPANYNLTDEEVTELDPQAAAQGAGLPDTPGKSRVPPQADVPTAPPNGGEPDSMTGAVMEGLRVGAGDADGGAGRGDRRDEQGG
jgi:hypothetical protein